MFDESKTYTKEMFEGSRTASDAAHAAIGQRIDDLQKSHIALADEVRAVRTDLGARIEKVEERMHQVGERFSGVAERLARLEAGQAAA